MNDIKMEIKGNNNIDLYKNQERYNTYLKRKDNIYIFLFGLASIAALISVLLFPIFRYAYKGNSRTNEKEIFGDYTALTLIQKVFKGDLGKNGFLNIGLAISLVACIILSVYLVVGAILKIIERFIGLKVIVVTDKIFSFEILEIVATALLLCTFAAMIFSRVNIQGMGENLLFFWVIIVSSVIMLCTAIPLSNERL